MSGSKGCSGEDLSVHTRASRGSCGFLFMAKRRLWIKNDDSLSEDGSQEDYYILTWGALGSRPQEKDTTLFGDVGIATSRVQGDELGLVRPGGSSTSREGTSAQRVLLEATVTEIGESILAPNQQDLGLLGLCIAYWWCWIFFSFPQTSCLQRLDQITGLPVMKHSQVCPWFWLELKYSGTLSFGSRAIYTYSRPSHHPIAPLTKLEISTISCVSHLKYCANSLLPPSLCVWGT